jgi:hypothetical protein
MVKPAKRTRLGMRALKARVAIRGLAAIDRRTHAAKGLLSWRDDLISALGGAENASPMKLAIIEQATRAKLILDHVDAYLLSQESLLNRRSKRILPIVLERTKLAEHFVKLLAQLGLERQAKKVEDLDDYLARRAKELEAEKENSDETKSETNVEHP